MSLLNTLFTAHRLSSLHIGPEPLTPERLELLSRRLRDLLVGDTVRGVHLGLDSGASADAALHSQAGALERVEFAWVGVRELLRGGSEDGEQSDDERDNAADTPGPQALRLELRYENSGGGAYAAFLLPELAASHGDGVGVVKSLNPFKSWKKDYKHGQQWEAHPMLSAPSFASPQDEADNSRFVHLPLLLLRLPAPLRTMVSEFLAQTFDARISELNFASATLIGAFEQWVAESGTVGNRDVALTLGFRASQILQGGAPTSGTPQLRAVDSGIERSGIEEGHTTGMDEERQSLGLKTLDVVIPAEEVSGFIRAGRPEEKSRPGRRRAQPLEPPPQPFTDALAVHLDRHLALDMKHPAVRILRITCDGFVLSERRVKILDGGDGRAHKAVWSLLGELARQAKGHALGS